MTSGHNQGDPFPQHADAGGSRETAAPEPDVSAEQPVDPATGQPTVSEGQAGGQAGGEDESPEMTDELAKAQTALGELTGDLQRLQAEYVNYKKRVDRDRQLIRENAVYAALTPLLPVLDDLDRAREHGELEGGFKAVADSLERIVASLGLVKFGEPGDEFDPNFHEALMHAHSPDVTTTTCQSIIQAGYRIGDRVVRAARVTVVDPEPAAEVQQGEAPRNGNDNGNQ